MSSSETRSVGGTPRSSFDAIFDSSSLQSTRRRTSNTWKRVASLYSSPKQKEIDDGPDEDMWDNNDQDFQHQIMIEAKLQNKARLRPSIDEVWLNGATAMEEVASPNELLSPYSHANSQVASSSTPTLLTSFSDSPSLLGTPAWQQPLSSNPRPSSTTNASLMTSKSYSTLSSEASTAPTFPSPASSKAELRARQRYSGGNARLAAIFGTPNGGADSRTSMSEDISPTSTTFEQGSPASKVSKNQPITFPSSLSGHLQFGGWTQEQIDSPGAQADRQFSTLGSLAGNGSVTEEMTPSKYIASATVHDVQNARTYNQGRLASPPVLEADDLSDISTSNRHRGKALSALLGEPEEVIFANKMIGEGKTLPPLPSQKSKVTDYRNEEQGLISGLKKRLLPIKRTGGSPIKNNPSSSERSVLRSKTTNSIAASSSFPLYTSLSDKDVLTESQASDQKRRPSLPHISTMPAVPARRRFSMQHSPGMHSSFDSKAQNDVQETLVDSHSEESTPEPISFPRKPSMESVLSRISRPSDSRLARSRSRTENPQSNRNSIIEHVSYDNMRKRSSIISLGITPDMVNEIVPTSPALHHNTASEDICEELKGETNSIEEETNRRLSISSQSSSNKAPIRPTRKSDNAPLHRQPSIDSINPNERSSLEHSFNAAHNERWSTVGPAFLTYIDPQKTSAIEANAQNDFRPASPLENIFKGGRRDSEASLSLKRMTSNMEYGARDSISSARKDSLKTEQNAILSTSLAPKIQTDKIGSIKAEIDMQDSPKVKSPVKQTKTWSRRRSFVEPTANRLSNLIKSGIGKKSSGLLSNTSPKSKNQKSKLKQADRDGDVLELPSLNGWVEDSLSADRSLDSSGIWIGSSSPATASFTGSSANRSSAGGSSLNQKDSQTLNQNPIEISNFKSTEMRPSRSTYELSSERMKTLNNGSSTNLSSTLSCSNTTKRPTFGLDLQPDAASAFDSIPLPETPERSRSRAGSISSSMYGGMSNEHLVLPPPVLLPNRSEGRLSGEEMTSGYEPDLYRKASLVSDRTLSLPMPSDLPADVDDVEDLLDDEEEGDEEYEDSHDQTLTGDETLTRFESKQSHVMPSPSTDEVELLEDDDDAIKLNHSNDKDQIKNKNILLSSNNDNDSIPAPAAHKNITSLHTYRFPPARSSIEEGSRSTTSLLIPSSKSDNSISPIERINQSSSNSQNNSPIFRPILASHLRRPSSSASYV